MKKTIGILSLFIAFSCAVNNDESAFTAIRGKVNYPSNDFVFLEILTPNGYEIVDSSRLDQERSFLLSTNKESQDIYRLNFFDKQKISLVLNDQDISVVADGNTQLGKFVAKGSEEVELISKLNYIKNDFQIKSSIITQKLKTANRNKDSLAIDSLDTAYERIEVEFRDTLKSMIISGRGDLTSLLILFENFEIEPNLNLYKEQIPIMKDQLAEHWYFQHIADGFYDIVKVAVDSKAPQFTLPDPEGNLISLSSFKGKYVFLDFWASWCQPCRLENPELVKVYNKFKGQNFEIIGVSFDKKKESWLKAIKEDSLQWKHVSDLKYFDSDMIDLYNIVNVPTTILLDPEGTIIAKHVHADELEQILLEVL